MAPDQKRQDMKPHGYIAQNDNLPQRQEASGTQLFVVGAIAGRPAQAEVERKRIRV
jgi:hypothetical protein